MYEEHEEKIRNYTKEYLKKSLIGAIIYISMIILMSIICAYTGLSSEVSAIFLIIVSIIFFGYIIKCSLKLRKKSNTTNKIMLEKYNSGEITEEEYKEFVKRDSKGRNFIYGVIIVIAILRIISYALH